MSAELVIKALLEADAGVLALVPVAQMHSGARPEADPLPALVWEEVSDTPRSPIAGTPGNEPVTGRIQVNCLGRSSAEVKSLKDAVVAACHRQSGTLGGIVVTACVQDMAGPRSYDALVDTWMQPVDFLIHYMR